MLFDLRSPGRRGLIRVTYVILAILMGGGLIFFGIGGGTSQQGGLLNALTNSTGNANVPSPALVKQEKELTQQVAANPKDAAKLQQLALVRIQIAGQGKNFDSATNNYSASGKAELARAAQVWQQYLALNPKTPNDQFARQMIQVYTALNSAPDLVAAQEIIAQAKPTASNYAQLAQYAYIAKDTRVGDLSAAKAVQLAPPAQRKTLKAQLDAIKKNPSGATSGSGGSGSGTTTP